MEHFAEHRSGIQLLRRPEMKRTLIIVLAVLAVLLFVACDSDVGSKAFTEVLESSGSFVLDGTPYDTLQEAVSASAEEEKGANAAKVIKLTKDVIGRGASFPENCDVILDLDGHTLVFADVTEAALTLGAGSDVTIQNGTLSFLDKGGRTGSDRAMIKGDRIDFLALGEVTIESDGNDIDVTGTDGSKLLLNGTFGGDIHASGIETGILMGKVSCSTVELDGKGFEIVCPMDVDKLIIGAEETKISSTVTVGLLELDAIDNDVTLVIDDDGHLTINDDYLKVVTLGTDVSVVCTGSRHSSITNNTDKEIDVEGDGDTHLYIQLDDGNKNYFGELADALASLEGKTYTKAKVTYMADAAEGDVEIRYPVTIDLNGCVLTANLTIGVPSFSLTGNGQDYSVLIGSIDLADEETTDSILYIEKAAVNGTVDFPALLIADESVFLGKVTAWHINAISCRFNDDIAVVDDSYFTESSVNGDIYSFSSVHGINSVFGDKEAISIKAEEVELYGCSLNLTDIGQISLAEDLPADVVIIKDPVEDSCIGSIKAVDLTVTDEDYNLLAGTTEVSGTADISGGIFKYSFELSGTGTISDGNFNDFTYSGDESLIITGGYFDKATINSGSGRIDGKVTYDPNEGPGLDSVPLFLDLNIHSNGWSIKSAYLAAKDVTQLNNLGSLISQDSYSDDKYVYIVYYEETIGSGDDSDRITVRPSSAKKIVVDFAGNDLEKGTTAVNNIILDFAPQVTAVGRIILDSRDLDVRSERLPYDVVYADNGDGNLKLMEGVRKNNQYIYAYPVVSFNANGGKMTMDDQVVGYDFATALSANGFTREGYTFSGWAQSPEGEAIYEDEGEIVTTSDVTLYAVWSNDYRYITFHENARLLPEKTKTQKVLYNIPAVLDANDFRRTGYTFYGWNTSGDGTDTPYADTTKITITEDTDLYALWKANSYKVIFDKNASNATGTMYDQSFTYDVAQLLTANGYALTGHHFIGWNTDVNYSVDYDDKQEVENLTSEKDGEVTLHAVWQANDYIVVFNGNGSTGGATANEIFTYGEVKALTSNGYTRTGYTFAGWNTKADGSGVGYNDKAEVSNLTALENGKVMLYAQWTANTYEVKFNGNESTSGTMNNQTLTYDVDAALTANQFVKTGYTFLGWAYSASGAVEFRDKEHVLNLETGAKDHESVTLYAIWAANTYTVTFNANGGTTSPTWKTVAYDSTYGTLPVPGRTGYSFDGWYTAATGGTKVTAESSKDTASDQTLYAHWTVNTYTVSYNGNGSTGGSTAESSHTYDTAKALTTNGFTKTGYTFVGWATSSSGPVVYVDKESVKNLSSVNQATVTLYAIWAVNTYTVTFNANGGTTSPTWKTVAYDSTYGTLPVPGRTGYSFDGWYTAATGGTKVTAESSKDTASDQTLYAHWTVNTYTVSYNGNGSTGGSTAESSHTYDTAKALTTNGFTKTGYTFVGWATSSSGPVVYVDKESVKNLSSVNQATVTLYAKWAVNSYSVTLNTNGGVINSGNVTSYVYGVGATLPSSLSRPGWVFSGWYTDSSYSGSKVTSITSSDYGNKTYYAKWTLGYVTLYSKEIIIAKSPMYKDNIGSATAGSPIGDSPAGYVWIVGYGDSTLTDNRVYLPDDTEFVILKQASDSSNYSLCPERSTMQSFGWTALNAVGRAADKEDLWMWTITIESVYDNGNVRCYRFGHLGGKSVTNNWSYGDRPGSGFDYLSISTRGISY